MKLHKMIEIYLKYDNLHTNRVFNALNFINNHVNSCTNFMLSVIEMIFIHWHSCVMFAMKSMSICND